MECGTIPVKAGQILLWNAGAFCVQCGLLVGKEPEHAEQGMWPTLSEPFALERVFALQRLCLAGPQPVELPPGVPAHSASSVTPPTLFLVFQPPCQHWGTPIPSSLFSQSLKSDEDAESAKEPQNELFEAQGKPQLHIPCCA